MTKKDFEEFLTKIEQEKQSTVTTIDWEAEKNEWLLYLGALHGTFEDCLKEYMAKGIIKTVYEEIELEEENIGRYKANTMNIHLGGELIRLKPIGTNLIGAKGRVDMIGKVGSITLVLVSSKMKSVSDHIKISVHVGGVPVKKEEATETTPVTWEWRFVTAPPTRKYQPVNEETIYSAIMEISNGQ